MTLKGTALAPAPTPSEPKGRLVERAAPAAAVPEVAAARAVPVLRAQRLAPQAPPSEPKGVLVGALSSNAPAAPLRGFAPPILEQRAPSDEAEPLRRIVGIPAQPRVRVSYWFEGGALICEAVMMDEAGALVHEARFDQADPMVWQGFNYYGSRLVRAMRDAGTIVTIPATPAPASEPPAPAPAPVPVVIVARRRPQAEAPPTVDAPAFEGDIPGTYGKAPEPPLEPAQKPDAAALERGLEPAQKRDSEPPSTNREPGGAQQ